jgi:hypothetical protein
MIGVHLISSDDKIVYGKVPVKLTEAWTDSSVGFLKVRDN